MGDDLILVAGHPPLPEITKVIDPMPFSAMLHYTISIYRTSHNTILLYIYPLPYDSSIPLFYRGSLIRL
jgi:hypothetical protein